MKVATLIAYGANNIEVPCRLFDDMESGAKRCAEIFGVEGNVKDNGMVVWGYKDIDLEKDTDENHAISSKLFTKYYYGCGAPDRFVLKEVSTDEAFVCFDLD